MVARLSSGTKKKISLAQKGKKNSFYGRRHSKHSILMIARAKKAEIILCMENVIVQAQEIKSALPFAKDGLKSAKV